MNIMPGVSGRAPEYDSSKVTHEDIANELALLQLGDFEPLNIRIDTALLRHELRRFDKEWTPYLPRTDRPNNREGLTLTTFPGYSHRDCPSLAEISVKERRVVKETECCIKTEVYDKCSSCYED